MQRSGKAPPYRQAVVAAASNHKVMIPEEVAGYATLHYNSELFSTCPTEYKSNGTDSNVASGCYGYSFDLNTMYNIK